MKNSLTPAGIEPATFRFVAQRLNHCATFLRDVSKIKFALQTWDFMRFIESDERLRKVCVLRNLQFRLLSFSELVAKFNTPNAMFKCAP